MFYQRLSRAFEKLSHAASYGEIYGTGALLKRLFLGRKTFPWEQGVFPITLELADRSDILKRPLDQPLPPPAREVRRVGWLLPETGPGSGGHRHLLRIVRAMAERGYENHIYVWGRPNADTPEAQASWTAEHFFPIDATFHLRTLDFDDVDALVATGWHTAFPVWLAPDDVFKVNVFLDLETEFFVPGSRAHCAADLAYRFPIPKVVYGSWIREEIAHRYGQTALEMPYAGFRPELAGRSHAGPGGTVIAYLRPFTERRGSILAMRALEHLHHVFPDVRIEVFGSEQLSPPLRCPHTNLGVLPPDKMMEHLRNADVGLALGFTNPSVLPFEMVAAGLPVVVNLGRNNEAAFEDGAGTVLVPPGAGHIADALHRLLLDPELRAAVAQCGRGYMTDMTWDRTTAAFCDHFEALCRGEA